MPLKIISHNLIQEVDKEKFTFLSSELFMYKAQLS